MTAHAHDHSSSSGDWQSTLRSKGYRLTPQRELVLRAVERLGHATPDEILGAVREESQAVNISTVYRTLELLEELGLVRHAHITDRAPTYHSAAAPEHVHLVCRECKNITEVDARRDRADDSHAAMKTQYDFTTDVGHLTSSAPAPGAAHDAGSMGCSRLFFGHAPPSPGGMSSTRCATVSRSRRTSSSVSRPLWWSGSTGCGS